jgi:hypothetical protein
MEDNLILETKTKCRDCQSPMILVVSRSGGFVSKNCIKCNNPRLVGRHELPDMECGSCGSLLGIGVRNRNYIYLCDRCNLEWEIASLVPHWDEHFDFWSLPVPSDFGIYQPKEVLNMKLKIGIASKKSQPD